MSTTLSAGTLLAVPLAPLVGSLLAGIFGTKFGGNWVGRRLAHSLTILGVAVAFVLSVMTFRDVALNGARFNETIYEWMVVGGLKMEIGFMVDGLTAMMMCVVTFVSLMVHIYTIGYMEEDDGYNRFFSYISLFTFSMLMLVMSNNLLQLFFGWEAVGLVSYLLIGFWYNKPTAIFANMKAFLVNRVGDFGFILGIGLIVAYTGSLNYTEIFAKADSLSALTLPGTGWMLVTVICICLFIGAMGKSAQFLLHTWLPDAMEGPTPVSALIHAATMVTAGVYLIVRSHDIYDVTPTARNVVIAVGLVTLLAGAWIGCTKDDIKKALAGSTMSQIGYMVLAAGLGPAGYAFAIFHLLTHGFFKANMFLGAGSVMHGMNDDVDMRHYGALNKVMPITFYTFGIGYLAILGFPGTSGFFSKDKIIETALAQNLWVGIAALIGAGVTAFYMTRLMLMTFFGQQRWREDVHPHESPKVMTVPLIVLAALSLFAGVMTLGSWIEDWLEPATGHPVHHEPPLPIIVITLIVLLVVAAGVALAWFVYGRDQQIADEAPPDPAVSVFTRAGRAELYGNHVNEALVVRPVTHLTRALVWADAKIVDGLVTGSADGIGELSGELRRPQTGFVRSYALMVLGGALVVLVGLLAVTLA